MPAQSQLADQTSASSVHQGVACRVHRSVSEVGLHAALVPNCADGARGLYHSSQAAPAPPSPHAPSQSLCAAPAVGGRAGQRCWEPLAGASRLAMSLTR